MCACVWRGTSSGKVSFNESVNLIDFLFLCRYVHNINTYSRVHTIFADTSAHQMAGILPGGDNIWSSLACFRLIVAACWRLDVHGSGSAEKFGSWVDLLLRSGRYVSQDWKWRDAIPAPTTCNYVVWKKLPNLGYTKPQSSPD